jgi:SAM-dependent methyltransferase
VKITEVMQQLRDEATRRHESAASAHNGTAVNVEPAWTLPAPPTVHVTPLKEGAVERFSELERQALQKTEVSGRVPKFLRRLFRKQGGFNKQILEVGKFLMKENREAKKRLREITAYLQAENGWLDGVTDALMQVQGTLQRRLQNQHSLEGRLLAMGDKVSQARSESLERHSQLAEDLSAVASARTSELAALGDALKREAKAREGVEERVRGQHKRLDGFSDILEAAREDLAGEAKVREAVEETVRGQHTRLDVFSNILEAARQALAAEAAVRQGLGLRFDEDHSTVTSLAHAMKEASEGIRLAGAENDRLSRELQEARVALSSMKDLLTKIEERLVGESSYLKRELHLHSQDLATLRASGGPVRGRKPAGILPASASEVDEHRFDSFYLAFENQFRGTRADIKQRVRVYVPFIKQARLGKRQSPVLDLGCGRGEWLELLREEALVGHGIDLNEFMVAECTERKLSVKQADVIQHLATLRSDSQGAITAFHLIEHLPFPILVKLFAESLRVLRPGGICIFETPNPDNLQVGSNRFYADPTHLHPLPHAFTKFAMSTAGFKRLEVLPLHPDLNAMPMTEEAAPIERFAHEMFFGAQDYAVIGRK